MFNNFTNIIEDMLALQQKGTCSHENTPWSYFQQGAYPQVNLYQDPESNVLEVTAEIAGVKKADLKIEVKGNKLRLSGEKKIQREEQDKIHVRERGSAKFDRSITLPFQVDPAKVEATYEDGLLTLNLHQAEEDKAHNITIN